MAKYLDYTGLLYFWNKIKLWVKGYINVSVTGSDKTITIDNDGTTVTILPIETVKVLDTTNTNSLSINSAEAIAGSGEIDLHKISKTGSYTDLLDKPTIPATNVIPATTTLNKVLVSTSTSGTAKWSDWSSAGFLKTNTSGVVSIDTTAYAPLASPALTGTPTAPTATSGTNTTLIATTEFVQTAVTAGTGAVNIDGITGSTINRYGVCNTSGSTAAKTVTITSGTFPASLTSNSDGLRITVRFASANSADNPTLNVNNTGAIPIYDLDPGTGLDLSYKSINGICDFIYYESKGSGGWHLASDGRVSCEKNHYNPTADENYELTGSLSGTAGTYTIDTEYTLLTGVKAQRDSKGHVTGLTYTALKIKNTNTDTKVNVTKALTTKAYLLGVSTTPTTTALALETLSDTAVYLDTTAGKLTATNFAGKINDVTVSKATTGFTIAGGTTSKTLTVNDTYTLGAACAKAVDSSISANSSSTNLPTSAAVESRISEAITAAQVGAAMFLGVIKSGTSLTALPTSGYKKGWYWIVGTAGTYAGVVCEAGDTIFCVNDYASAFSNDDFNVVQTNIETITNAEIDVIISSQGS